MFDMTSAHR